LRPRASAPSAMTSRKGSQALERGDRLGVGAHGGIRESVDACSVVTGLTSQSRWTPPAWWPLLPAIRFAGRRDGLQRPGRLQVGAGRLPADARGLLDAAKGPAHPPQRQDRLSLLFVQDLHPACGSRPTAFASVSVRYPWWPVFKFPSVAGLDRPPRVTPMPGLLFAGFSSHGIAYQVSAWSASDIYEALEPLGQCGRGRGP
jgi:hypothetical protein